MMLKKQPLILKKTVIFNKAVDERRDEILELSKEIHHDHLNYQSTCKNIHDCDNKFTFLKKR